MPRVGDGKKKREKITFFIFFSYIKFIESNWVTVDPSTGYHDPEEGEGVPMNMDRGLDKSFDSKYDLRSQLATQWILLMHYGQRTLRDQLEAVCYTRCIHPKYTHVHTLVVFSCSCLYRLISLFRGVPRLHLLQVRPEVTVPCIYIHTYLGLLKFSIYACTDQISSNSTIAIYK